MVDRMSNLIDTGVFGLSDGAESLTATIAKNAGQSDFSHECSSSANVNTHLEQSEKSTAPKLHMHIIDICACGIVLYVLKAESLSYS